MSERRKRRTQSAADVELGGVSPSVEPSQPSQRSRRKSNARQARLVAFPAFFNGMGPATPQQQYGQMGFAQTPVVFPPPQMTNNSIMFTLLPGQMEIPYTVNIDKSHLGKAILRVSGNVRNLTFSINQTLFTNVIPPIDVTSLILHGANLFQFCTFGFPGTSFVEIYLEEAQDPDMLVKKVINEFPAPPPISQDPYATMNCPISNAKIENPGRGINCIHYQCFDLKAFIQRGISTNNWTCPICGNPINFNDLRYDREYMKQNAFGIDATDDIGQSIFNSITDPRFDPFDNGSIFLDRDF